MTALRIFLLAALWAGAVEAAAAAETPSRLLGIEGDVSFTLDRADYRPRPMDDRTPLILMIDSIRPAGGEGHVYDIHYIGFEAGAYRLADYLMLPDGSPATGIGEVSVQVRSVLPPNHNGALAAYVPQPFPALGGYRMLLKLLAGLWLLGLAAFLWFGRRRRVQTVVEAVPPPPTYAERMRPLVQAAAAGRLDPDGQAELERLMTGYWRDRLHLNEPRMADNLAALKRHAEAGLLLNALERWLHRPGGASAGDIQKLLEPYQRAVPAAGEGA